MFNNNVAISLLIAFLLISLVGVVYADLKDVNGTDNLSRIGNISANMTNQSYQDGMIVNNSSATNVTDIVESTGGIKNFMKSFKFQSNV